MKTICLIIVSKLSRLFLCLTMAIMLFQCKDNEVKISNEDKKLRTFLDFHKIDWKSETGKRVYFFIPLELSCESCLNPVVEYLKTATINKKLFFVISVRSKKTLNIFLQGINADMKQIIKDDSFLSVETGLAKFNPIVYFVNNQVITSKDVVTPSQTTVLFDKIADFSR